ncbi:unnamed protein product [Ectocarpus sp. 4 AP-2014]|uniref:EsV-1-175 n=1 Tax=Ectocarpus siliculosus virus 1 (isolate New Zealand/Kaikoura/1988) TaxID=654926 RepID=Q8QNB2_ESV1K|nr:EsV-1-175 [Ectocarpus siliculosus virus 1]AAK14589.1 EsV-1-175 [Ectocarpus siliculosus virus 1]
MKGSRKKAMPSKFILEQAELLHRTKDAKPVLDNLRNKYALSSFPSQMSRVKVEWCKFGERHEQFYTIMEQAYRTACSADNTYPRRAVKELRQYMKDDMIMQMKKWRAAKSPAGLTGDEKLDDLVCKVQLLPDYMKEYRLTETDRTSSSELSKKSLETRSMDCVEIPDADELVERCIEKIKANTECPFVLAACISLVCGRRSIEILKTGEFSEGTDARGHYSCFFTGAAKKKVVCKDKCEIPLLIKYKYLKHSLKRVRENIPCENLTNQAINSKYSHKLGDAAKILTGNMRVRFHDLRGLYGMISHRTFKNNCSINIWLTKTLLHEALDTSIFYSRFRIDKCSTNRGEWAF